jgi:hypothetical protein
MSIENTRRGLGDVISRWLGKLGARSCAGCEQRVLALNDFGSRLTPLWVASNPCKTFAGRCTGFGHQQCVVAPTELTPDATTLTQCCGGWFQYPWIQICPGSAPRQGCGFCLF